MVIVKETIKIQDSQFRVFRGFCLFSKSDIFSQVIKATKDKNSVLFNEGIFLVFPEGDLQFSLGIHHDGATPGDGFTDWFS